MFFGRARGHHDASGPNEVSSDAEQESDIASASSNHRIKPIGKIADDGLEPTCNDPRVGEGELSHDRRQEGRSTLPGLHHRQAKRRVHQLQRNSGDTGSGADIEDVPGISR